MTKMHFQSAASMVRAILDGEWTNEPPAWAERNRVHAAYHEVVVGNVFSGNADYVRAVQTAEAFIILFQQHNPRFDVDRFLIACGLKGK